jgi:putative oxygen-independent coproporphyrinogen III oxidase
MGCDHRGVSFGVYVHIPFCAAKCDYCDFATWTDRTHLIDDYVDACVEDVARWRAAGMRAADTVFFGGGTPSLLAADALVRILEGIPRIAHAEVTVECNPDALTSAQIGRYREAGVTRLSIGVQSFAPNVLAALGRTHDPDNVRRAFTWAHQAGIEHLNADLIYGTPGESDADWEVSLDATISLEPDHVSCYALGVEPATTLGRRVAAGESDAPDDDVQARRYVIADERLTEAGYEWYEISNWARPGGECVHNLEYWRGGDYLAIGCAAHGFLGGRRWWNVRTPERYIERIGSGRTPEGGGEALDEEGRGEEARALALRTRAGALADRFDAAALEELIALDLVRVEGRRVALTRSGRLLATDVTARLLARSGG